MSKKQQQEENYQRYLTTWYGRDLLAQHSLAEEGIWQVHGEDPNCDFGGHHHTPFLGNFEGVLDDVIREAVNLSGFWQWGSGGKITKHKDPIVKKVKTKAERDNVEYEELSELRKELEASLAKVNAKLAELK